MSSAGDEEGHAPVDIKSRIASFNKKADESAPVAAASKAAEQPQRGLRKTPSTSQLLPAYRRNHDVQAAEAQDDGATSSGKPGPPTAPMRPRAMTGSGAQAALVQTSSTEAADDTGIPKDVKSMIAMYGGKTGDNGAVKPIPPKVAQKPAIPLRTADGSSTSGSASSSNVGVESSEQSLKVAPAIPLRPSIAISASSPDADAPTPTAAAPQLPSRAVLQPEYSGSSSNSGSGSGSASAAAAPSLPARKAMVASSTDDLRRSLAKASTSTDSLTEAPSLPKRPGSRNAALETASLESRAAPPPPRHRTTKASDTLGSTARSQSSTAAVRRLPAAGASSSPLSASPSRAAGSSSAGSSSPRYAQSGPAMRSQAVAPSTSVSTVEALAPPPRHIDTLRSSSVSSSRQGQVPAPLSGADLLFAQRPAVYTASRQARRRTRRRPAAAARPASDFACEPASEAARARYEALFDTQLAAQQEKQGDRSGTQDALAQRTIVKLWRRSRLDSAFLGRVWQEALKARKPEAGGIGREPFVRALSAIDAELKQRRQSLTT